MHLPKEPQAESIYQQALVNIVLACQYACQQIKNKLEPYAITQQQYNVLRILKMQYPSACTINMIKSKIQDKMCDVSRIVDRLIEKGYLEKTINYHDKRAVDIVLADKGVNLLKKIDRDIDFSEVISTKLAEAEVLQLNEILQKFRT